MITINQPLWHRHFRDRKKSNSNSASPAVRMYNTCHLAEQANFNMKYWLWYSKSPDEMLY